MGTNLALTRFDDPATLGFPPTLPVELALHEQPVKEICESYGITRDEWLVLRESPLLIQAVQDAVDMLKIEGMSFKLKARLQAEELLKSSWKLIHDATTGVGAVPAAVKADLIKFTIRAAGLDASGVRGDGSSPTGGVTALQINLHLEK